MLFCHHSARSQNIEVRSSPPFILYAPLMLNYKLHMHDWVELLGEPNLKLICCLLLFGVLLFAGRLSERN